MRKNCSRVRKKIEKKVCKFEAVRPRICNVFENFVPHTKEQFFSQLVINIMVLLIRLFLFFPMNKKNDQKLLGYGNNRKYTEKIICFRDLLTFSVQCRL